jgi:hypothetical protein
MSARPGPAPPPAPGARPADRAARDRRLWAPLDRFELGSLVALFAFSFVVLAGMVVRARLRGGVTTGADSYVAVDQLQYLNWTRQAAHHLALRNLYDLAPSSRSFVHPGVLVTGGLHRLGLGVVASYQALKPVAVLVLFAGVLLVVRRFLADLRDRRLALVLCLFSVSPVAAALGWSGLTGSHAKLQLDFLAGELWTGNYLWGYVFTALAVGLLPLGLLAYERGRDGGRLAALGAAAGAGLLCAWFQPWQGATFALAIGATELVCLARARGLAAAPRAARDLALPLAATAAPLLYYLVLSRTDSAWKIADRANQSGGLPLWVMVVGLAPLAVPALLAYRLPAPDFGSLALRVWPIAGLAVFYAPAGTFPGHALQGLTIPLVVLATLALRSWLGARPLPAALGGAVALLLVVPGLAYRADALRGAFNAGLQPYFLRADEHDALEYLARAPGRGGVLTPYFSGQVVPAYTGRATWVGATSWTPDFQARNDAMQSLFRGRLDRRAAERLVRRSGARFIYSDCEGRADIARLVAAVTYPPRRFGCATVYRVR